MTNYRFYTFVVAALLLGSCGHPVKQGQPRTSVKFLPAISIALNGDRFLWVVAGETGEIVWTSDGGATWRHTQSPPGERFWQLSFIDPLNGWGVSDHAAIWRTTDGGASWVSIARLRYDDDLSEHAFEHMSFMDEKNGWVVDPLSIWRTEDGGQSWSQHQPDLLDEHGVVQLLRTDFVSANSGWATGTSGALYTSSDGGRSWTRSPPICEDGVSDILFLDNLTGWISCGLWGIFGTQDGGRNWFKAHLPDARFTVSDENTFFRALSFTSSNEGWAAGAVEGYATESKFQSQAILIHTSDGGHNWVEVAVAADERIYDSVRFADASVGWLFGGSGRVYRTIDAGKSWTPVLSLPVD